LSADDVIGGYELLRRIGKGGMAEVWLGRKADAAKAGKTVAVKLIAPHLAGQERYSRMFRAEAELSAMLTHSNIVQVFDEGEERGISYLVMEFVDGINLVRLREALKLLGDDAPLAVGARLSGRPGSTDPAPARGARPRHDDRASRRGGGERATPPRAPDHPPAPPPPREGEAQARRRRAGTGADVDGGGGE